jgi:hypothetical protein
MCVAPLAKPDLTCFYSGLRPREQMETNRMSGATQQDARRPFRLSRPSLGIAVTTKYHPPVFTVEESKALRDEIPGGHTKNLFLKDKKGRYFLLTVGEDAVIDLKTIHTAIGASGRVSFGKPDAADAVSRRHSRRGDRLRRRQRHGSTR